MKYAITSKKDSSAGKVKNIALANAPLAANWILIPEGTAVNIGDEWDGSNFISVAPVLPDKFVSAHDIVALLPEDILVDLDDNKKKSGKGKDKMKAVAFDVSLTINKKYKVGAELDAFFADLAEDTTLTVEQADAIKLELEAQ